MGTDYSLAYFDRIFGRRGPEFWELVAALEDQLGAYAADLREALAARDADALSRLRHTHRPVVENLELEDLLDLEQEARRSVEEGASDDGLASLADRFAGRLQNLARALGEERTQAGY